jgi:hypothetical protein
MIDQSPLAINVVATDGTSLLTNDAWRKLWGLEKGGASASANVFEDDRLRAAGLLPYIEESAGGASGEAAAQAQCSGPGK